MRGIPSIETMEGRVLLTGGNTWKPVNADLADAQNGPMANEGTALVGVYQQFLKNGGDTAAIAASYPLLQFNTSNATVAIGVNSNGTGNYNDFLTSLKNLGMSVGSSSPTYGLVTGWMPISALPQVAALPQTMSAHPIDKPFTNFQGIANNEAATSEQAVAASAKYNVTGAGVTVGIISDSANLYAGGLADSIKTGDLPSTVQDLQESTGDPQNPKTDEGRAMMENVYDIAPGAGLAFASSGSPTVLGDPVGFANSINMLATKANAKVIADDVAIFDEPWFQNGIISQAINNVVQNDGVSYFSAAGNESVDNGYLSTFRSVQATVGSLGSGTFMNFAPSGSPVTELPITINSTNIPIEFQYDQPFATQEPSGSPYKVTSQVNFYILDSSGNIVASGTNNNVATQEPIQQVSVPSAGNYFVAIQVVSGNAPSHVEFMRLYGGPDNALQVSQQFGTAGGTSYPSTPGHNADPGTIGVGAVPWWAPAPYLNTNPLLSEPFSSNGPALNDLNPDGSPKTGTILPTQTPLLSGADGGNTSFFGSVIDTSAKPPADTGEPSTAKNLSQNLPSFFGTSAAVENVGAIAALMLQKSPGLNEAQILAGLETGTTPLNGATPGTWNPQGGYGFVNAVNALAAIDTLHVASSNPANGATVTATPSYLQFTFSKPVNFSTLSAADLKFTKVPSNVYNVVVGAPIAVDNATDPTVVDFPYSFSVLPGTIGNGTFGYTLSGPVVAQDGKTLVAYSGGFVLNDQTLPTVTNVSINDRVVSITFSKAMNPASINLSTVVLVREVPGAAGIDLNTDPRAVLTYNPLTNTATLNYTALDQTEFPSADYILVVKGGSPNGTGSSVTDVVGHDLAGSFSGVFPSGSNGLAQDFIDNLGVQTLTAPVITSFGLAPLSQTGIPGVEDTNQHMPTFVGQVAGSFPGEVNGLTVYAEFATLHGGNLNLTPLNGRGTTGTYDVQVTTTPSGSFSFQAPYLPEGFTYVRLVVVGQADAPPLPGLSSLYNSAFRIDTTAPQITGASLTPGGALLPVNATTPPNYDSLTSLSLDVVDPASPSTGPYATPAQVLFPALNPTTATNVSNYSLINTSTGVNESSYIATASFTSTTSDFVSAPNRTSASQPYYGRVDLTFLPGLPAGLYHIIAHTTGGIYGGLTDAAGNPLNESTVPGQPSADFNFYLNIQAQPVYIESVSTNAANAQGNTLLPRSYYEINPRSGDVVSAPPTTFYVDVSTPLNASNSYTNAIQLIATSATGGSASTGAFGNLGIAGLGSSGTGFTRFNPAGTTVTLGTGPYGPDTRLTLQLPAGTVLPADDYRLYMPNSGSTAVYDIFGNQLDGEFLGNPVSSGTDLNGNPAYQDLLPNGQYRPGMSGNGVAGGAYMTGFVVVPTGNLIYARPDYIENPLLPSTYSTGSITNPYPVLAPQAAVNSLNQSTYNNGDPNGGLNSPVNFLTGFNPAYDRAGLGRFERSAFYAASQLSRNGPVVIVALPGTPQRDPLTGTVSQQTFVLQAPSGSDPVINNGSGSVPFNTMLAMNPGSTLKLENASLFVQNQGSSLNVLGGPNPNQTVTFTSYADNTVGGVTNGNPTSVPHAGDWGGIVFRNFDQAGRSTTFPVDVTLLGPNGQSATSGEDDALSSINFAVIHYGGGAVPATLGTRYDEVMLYNSRPAITNDTIIGGAIDPNNPTGGSQAGISGDLNSFREDDTASGPLIRNTTVTDTSLNGIWVRPLSATGDVQATNAVTYPSNPVTLGGVQNYVFNDPLPYILTSAMEIGLSNDVANPGVIRNVMNRLYIAPGMMVKSEPGAGIRVLSPGASLIVGDRTYISRWDAQASYGSDGLPSSPYAPQLLNGSPNPNFVYDSPNDAQVLFTTALDNAATTFYTDPVTGQKTVIVPAINSLNTPSSSTPIAGDWGRIQINSGAYGVINGAIIQYGGGGLNVPGGTNSDAAVLQFADGFLGTRFMVTDNTITNNLNSPVSVTPDGLLAGDTLRPLASGAPYFRNNVFTSNPGGNGLLVEGNPGLGYREVSNNNVNTLWDLTDLTYILKGTVVMGGGAPRGSVANLNTTTFLPEPTPSAILTVQSQLGGTQLADGSFIPQPGQSVIIKTLNPSTVPTEAQTTTATTGTEDYAGAGFIAGVDNGVDPTTDPLVDVGAYSQMRFLGIPGNQTTGQVRVPVIITSIHDSTVGTTVRGVNMDQAITGDTTAPAAGDGGVIYFGGLMLPNYNVTDPRAGSIIDNADIRYMTRVEMQAGTLVNYLPLDTGTTFSTKDDPYGMKTGLFQGTTANASTTYPVQDNAEQALMIADSNLSNMSDAGVFVHPGFGAIGFNMVTGSFDASRSPVAGQANLLYMVNDTVSNTPIGVNIIGDPNNNTNAGEPSEFLSLNNDFYNTPTAISANAIVYNPGTPQTLSQIHVIAMDNIFDGASTAVMMGAGMLDGSIFQYNLFYNSVLNPDGSVVTPIAGGAALDVSVPNDNPILGQNPLFVDPATGNFNLKPNSPAIDAARSELNLNPTTAPDTAGGADVSTTLLPVVTQELNAQGGIRTSTDRIPISFIHQVTPNNPPPDYLRLPGSTQAGQVDLWFAALPTSPYAVLGPDSVPGTWAFTPGLIPGGSTSGVPGGGERDQRGFYRIDDPNVPNTGFGSKPFFDMGAFEYVPTYPPHVSVVTATVTNPASASGSSFVNLYGVGSYAGTNQAIQTINVKFDQQLDPTTLNGATVLLESSGGTGNFNTASNPNAKFFNLSGKLSFNSLTDILTINIGAAGLTLPNDEYRLFLIGNGASVIRDLQGYALDGQNTVGGSPDGAQLALPSGSGSPGSTFYDTFVINTTAPTIASGTKLTLDPSTDSNIAGDSVTNINKPSFSGTISVAQPAIDPIAGQTVILDISTQGNGVFDRLNAGSAVTNANGQFVVTVGQDAANTGLVTNTTALPDSPYNVGPDGIIRTADDSGYTWARVRIIDSSGNVSDLPTDPVSAFQAKGALTGAVIDTAPPTVTSFSPLPNTVINPTSGTVTFTFDTNKNIDKATLNSNSIVVNRAGPSGIIGGKDQIAVPIDPNSISVKYLGGAAGRLGPEQISFTISGNLPNDAYTVTLKGTGSSPITDVAGNDLAGQFNGTFPSGQSGGAGTDFNETIAIDNPSNVQVLYVGAAATYNPSGSTSNPVGTVENPYPTIAAAEAAAAPGDEIGVLPGVYTESVTLKPFIMLVSAATTSTDSSLVAGDALQTIIRAPIPTTTSSTTTAPTEIDTISAANLPAIPGLNTEVAGFTIMSTLTTDPNTGLPLGPIDPISVGVSIVNSNILLDRNYIIDSHYAVHVVTSGTAAPTPRIWDNGIIGNDVGLTIEDQGTASLAKPTLVLNNTIAFNSVGVEALNGSTSPLQAVIGNNIIWQNHDLTSAHAGTGIDSTVPNKLFVISNLIANNGPSDTNLAGDTVNVGNGFNPSVLSPYYTDALGNFTGNPAFLSPVDPRPDSTGPATFFLSANYDLTKTSAAIDAANNLYAPPYDFLDRGRVRITGRGFPGTGPADVGAFEYNGTGGISGTTSASVFRVVATSLSTNGGSAASASFTTTTAPESLYVKFSQNVNPQSVNVDALTLSGTGLNPLSPTHPTSLAWVDGNTVEFFLNERYNSSGTVKVSLAAGSAASSNGQSVQPFSDTFSISSPETIRTFSVAPPQTQAPASVLLPSETNLTIASSAPTVAIPSATPLMPLTPAAAPSPFTPPSFRHFFHKGRKLRK